MPLPTDGELICGQCKTLLSKTENGAVVRSCWRCGSARLRPGPKAHEDVRANLQAALRTVDVFSSAYFIAKGYHWRWRHRRCGIVSFYTPTSRWNYPEDTIDALGTKYGKGSDCHCCNCGEAILYMSQLTMEENR